MLTSIKEAFNEERYYDAISNTINSSITMYSSPEDLEKESKVLIENSYKNIKSNIDIMSNTSTESLNGINKITKTFLKILDQIDDMKKSYSVEAAYNEFSNLAYEKLKKMLLDIVNSIIKVYQMSIRICSKIKNTLTVTLSNNKNVLNNDEIDIIKQTIKDKNIENVPIVNILYSETTKLMDFFKVTELNEFNDSKFSEYITYINMNLGNNIDKHYVFRLKEKTSTIHSISKLINDYSSSVIDHIFDINFNSLHAKFNKTYNKFDTLVIDMNKEIKNFYKMMDLNDYNLWVVHAYEYIPPFRSEFNNSTFKDVVYDLSKEKEILQNLLYAQHKEEFDEYSNNENINKHTILSLSSPLTAIDIHERIKKNTILKQSYNIKDLFKYDTVSEVVDKINGFIKTYDNIIKNTSLNHINHIITDIENTCKDGINSLIKYKSLLDVLNEILARENSNNNSLLRITILLLIKLFQDINMCTSSMTQLLLYDTAKNIVDINKIMNIINNLFNKIKIKIDGD